MSVSHGYNTIGGIEYGGFGEDKKEGESLTPTREHYCHTCAVDVANIWMCFMNGSMIGHNGLGIAFFSVDILKDMIVCWDAWVLMSLCQIIDYCFESLVS